MELDAGSVVCAPHDPELHAALAHPVQHGDVFRHVYRVPVGEGRAQGPEA